MEESQGKSEKESEDGYDLYTLYTCIMFTKNIYQFFFFLYSFLCNTSWPQSPLLALVLVSPHILCLHFPLNIPGLPGITSRHGIIRCNKTRHKPSYLDWMRQCSSRKRIPQKKKIKQHPYVYRCSTAEPCRLCDCPLVSVSPMRLA